MLDDFYKIGQVIEVRGQKLRIKVFENKNSNVFVYKGQIIKNVSVGSYVKIPKGYNCIVGKIEGEYINELQPADGKAHFSKESETISRIIEVSIIGVLKENQFKRGLIDIPLVFSDVYILMSDEVKKIFRFGNDPNNVIPIGYINDYKEEQLAVDSTSLFASHIGIFGNTGSGKSNTLAKLYTECIKKYENEQGFKNSRFIVIDFNGEYINAFTERKDVYNLSTRSNNGDKIPLPREFFEDYEMWSIVCDATEKTQKPFLHRVFNLYSNIVSAYNVKSYIMRLLEVLLRGFYSYPNYFPHFFEKLKELFSSVFQNIENVFSKLNDYDIRSNGTKFHRISSDSWCNTEEEYIEIFVSPIINACNELVIQPTDNVLNFIYFSLTYKLIEDVYNQIVIEEHIAPLVNRFINRYKDINKVIKLEDEFVHVKNFSVFSLLDVNIEFKKILPLIICKYYYEKHKNTNGKSLHIILDEAHNILSTSSERESQVWKDYRLETFEEIIKEGRKFGVFLTISSQRPSDISETIISQLHNYFIHRLVNNEDIRAIGKSISFIDSASYEMIPILPQGACIFTGVASNFPVLVQVDILDKAIQPQSNTLDLANIWK